ncbi:family S53 protease-like protein [Purpureocillium lavendulum]|uniref:Family S53 protease-like protein n=1 Tax=Purpureocillium lavendulum TaxID=1247861 RepID=A0AB34FTW5_9HYPO|nr:family S53 protease-like protein [Purpureocillium lavendulum]
MACTTSTTTAAAAATSNCSASSTSSTSTAQLHRPSAKARARASGGPHGGGLRDVLPPDLNLGPDLDTANLRLASFQRQQHQQHCSASSSLSSSPTVSSLDLHHQHHSHPPPLLPCAWGLQHHRIARASAASPAPSLSLSLADLDGTPPPAWPAARAPAPPAPSPAPAPGPAPTSGSVDLDLNLDLDTTPCVRPVAPVRSFAPSPRSNPSVVNGRGAGSAGREQKKTGSAASSNAASATSSPPNSTASSVLAAARNDSSLSPPSSRSISPRVGNNCIASTGSASKGKPASAAAAAMPARPANSNKRSADGGSGDEDAQQSHNGSAARLKLPRTDRGPEDFSSVVKNRLQSYTRTGQACDRCKVRKIRCDALPEGCSHCINLNLECYVTDRVTGRTERRGYMQELEREKNGMLAHIGDLEKLLREKGVEIKSWRGPSWAQYPTDSSAQAALVAARAPSGSDAWSQVGALWVKNGDATPKQSQPMPAINFPRSQWESRPDQGHIGVVGADDAPLSSIRGTKLSILGTTIDTTSFDLPDMDEPGENAPPSAPLYNKSVQAFLQSCMGVNPPLPAALPSRQDAFMYAEWYFMAVALFLPVLHKPTFMDLLTRVYDEPNFKPSIPESVMVHMVFATMYFHCGVRNEPDQRTNLNELSNKHYHFALTKIYDLLGSQELEAVQALAMIASHTRAFPKPGCGSIVASMALHRALELNLHRSSRRPGEGTDLYNELRKRTWWVILTVVVAITGRRGSPLPINVQDFDIEFPEPVADEALSDQGIDTSRSEPCPWEAGLAGFKIVPIFMEMYANIYSVRRDAQNYVNVIAALEKQLEKWEAELPQGVRINESEGLENASIPAIYVRIFSLELRLCLRHPSVAMTTDKQMMADNTRICDETAREFLRYTTQLYRTKALDTTWYQMSVYGACIFSMLVAQWERRFETTPQQMATLREEMQSWMVILRETSLLLGCGPGISSQIGQMMERTIGWIEHDMRQKDPKHSATAAPQAPVKQEEQPQSYQPTQAPSMPPQAHGISNGAAQGYQEASLNGQTSYPTITYSDGSQPTGASYQSDPSMFYGAAAAAPGVAGSTPPNPLSAFASQAVQHVGTPTQADLVWQTGRGNPWHDWTAAIADSQERYSASALLTLGGNPARASVTSSSMMADGSVAQTAADMGMVPLGGQWPLTMFDHTQQQQ